jgi:hypothetical protein
MATGTIAALYNNVIVETYTSSQTTTAADGTSGGIEFDCAKAGYTTAGVLSISKSGTGTSRVFPYDWEVLSSGNVRVYLRNIATSGSATYTVTVRVLFIKNQ